MKNLEIRALSNVEQTDNNIIEGYALKFNTESRDLGGFVETISETALENVDLSDVRCLVDHDPGKLLGRTSSGTLTLNVDDTGLHFRCALPNTTLGNDTLQMIKRGDITQCSFGFTVDQDSWERSENIMKRSIDKIGSLLEISLVPVPAYVDTDVSVAQRSLENVTNDMQKMQLQLQLDLLSL